jgi:hypothetical protein
MTVSGLALNEDVKWVSFHSSYDFGYLLKTLSCKELPDAENGFLEQLQIYFPCIFDIKVCIFSVSSFGTSYLTQNTPVVYDDCSGRYVRRLEWSRGALAGRTCWPHASGRKRLTSHKLYLFYLGSKASRWCCGRV